MGVNNSWRQPENLGDWMRDIEKRLMHEERRPSQPKATDVVGAGFRPYSILVADWNSDGPIVNGYFYSIANQVVNSPDTTRNWMGVVIANSKGQGLQQVWEYIDSDQAPSPSAANYSRAFITNDDGTRTYTPWSLGGTQDTGWIAAEFNPGWSNYGGSWSTAAYRRINGVVYLKGLVRGGSGSPFSLSSGFCPRESLLFTTSTGEPSQYARVDVHWDGTINPANFAGSWVSLNGISFVAEQ